ncbi:hypothetical protein PCASD_23544 [Puccinia coronata f. sp. avenae]|uniref:Uncharacterized protein n=1 Tax=Puccinia coronata f. sp. avenae TaxID=200324 RepID=A0A2N5TKX5_9BASI|nr:hypothetical protein PCASD_23544 [Puccinia coronata f. sp. avenae]
MKEKCFIHRPCLIPVFPGWLRAATARLSGFIPFGDGVMLVWTLGMPWERDKVNEVEQTSSTLCFTITILHATPKLQ